MMKIAVAGRHRPASAATSWTSRASRATRSVAIARSTGVDVITGEGLDEALAGVEVIIDAATGPSPDYESASAFFTTAARNLQAHGERAASGSC